MVYRRSRKTLPTYGLAKLEKKVRNQRQAFNKRVKRAVGFARDRRYAVFDTISSYLDAGSIVPMFNIVEGDQPYGERQGDKITPTALKLKYSWQAGDANNIVRLMIVQWKGDDNVNPPTVLNEIVDVSTQGTQNFPNTQPWFLGNKNFSLVYDSGVIALNDTASNGTIARNVNIYGKRLSKVQYSTGARGWNNFYIVAMSDSSVAPHPQLRLQAQLEYDA